MRALRIAAVVFGVANIAYAVLWLLAGEYRLGASLVLVGAGVILFVTWARGYPTAYPAREWLALGLIVGGAALVGSPLVAAAIFVGAVALQLASGRRILRRLSPDFEILGADEVMPGAEPTVAAFEAEGFTRAGAYATQVPRLWGRKRVVSTVLVGPARDCHTGVTDRVVEVASRFAGRWLITINSGLSPLPAQILRQALPGGSPAELVRAHRTALDILAQRDVHPDRLEDDAAAVESAVEEEKRAVEFAAGVGLRRSATIETRGKAGDAVLGDDARSGARIDAWLASGAGMSG